MGDINSRSGKKSTARKSKRIHIADDTKIILPGI
jgi:hypothetical protein